MAAAAITMPIGVGGAHKLNKPYFPKNNGERNNRVQDLPLIQLRYLALIPGGRKSPFTERQMGTIRASYQKNCNVVWSLRIGITFSVIATLGLAYMAFSTDNNSSLELKVGLATFAGLVSVAMVGISYWATGFAPHASSNAFNDQQDALLEMEETYENLAYRLIALYYSAQKETAEQLAQQIQVKLLERKISQVISNPSRGRLIVARIEEAVDHITNQTVPDNIRFAYFIRERAIEVAIPSDGGGGLPQTLSRRPTTSDSSEDDS